MAPGKGQQLKQISQVRIFLANTDRNMKIFQTLNAHKYSDAYTFFAIYETNLIMRRRQAETLLGRSVMKCFT